ncbi:MAG: ATP-binding protein [Promethearchaeota archaeon]
MFYYILRFQQNKENVQTNSDEYKWLKKVILTFLLVCMIPEVQVIISLNMEYRSPEKLIQNNSFIPIFISHGFLVGFLIFLLPTMLINQKTQIELPYPSRSRAKEGNIEIGRIKFGNKKKYKFKLSITDLERHVFICGSTGSGKTNFHQRFLIQLNDCLNVPFLLCEFKGEYQCLQKEMKNLLVLKPGYNFFINIFDPENTDPKVHAERLFQAFRSGMKFEDKEFSPQMERVFVDILVEMCKDEKNRDWDAFKQLSKNYFSNNSTVFNQVSGSIEQSIYAIQNRIRRYCTGTLSEIFVKKIGMKVKDIFNHKVIVDLSSIINLGGDKVDALFFLNVLLKYLYDENLSRGSKNYQGIQHITILEDAQYFAPQQLSKKSEITTYIEDIALLLRGTGECLITLATRPALSEEILANCGVLISFKEHMQKELLRQLLNLENEQERYLSELELGQCIIRVNSIEQPFSLIVPYTKRAELNEDEVSENNMKIFERITSQLKIGTSFQEETDKKLTDYCIYCGHGINSHSKDNICGFCKAYLEETERESVISKNNDEFNQLKEFMEELCEQELNNNKEKS